MEERIFVFRIHVKRHETFTLFSKYKDKRVSQKKFNPSFIDSSTNFKKTVLRKIKELGFQVHSSTLVIVRWVLWCGIWWACLKTWYLHVKATNETKLNNKNFRSSHLEVHCKDGVLKSFANFAGRWLCWSFFFDKVAGLQSATLFKKDWHRVFLWILRNF